MRLLREVSMDGPQRRSMARVGDANKVEIGGGGDEEGGGEGGDVSECGVVQQTWSKPRRHSLMSRFGRS